MVPTIGLIICAYAIYRIASDILRGPSRFPHVGFYVAATALGILAILFIVSAGFDLLTAATAKG
jgi:hypothetical protein